MAQFTFFYSNTESVRVIVKHNTFYYPLVDIADVSEYSRTHVLTNMCPYSRTTLNVLYETKSGGFAYKKLECITFSQVLGEFRAKKKLESVVHILEAIESLSKKKVDELTKIEMMKLFE